MKRPTQLAAWQARWARLPAREQGLLKLAAVVVLAALLWQGLLAPAVKTLRSADAQARALDAQLQQMRSMQQQTLALRSQPAIGPDEAQRALELATQQALGGTARLTLAGDRANVSLSGATADALAQWLAQARLNARSVPIEARLSRASSSGTTTWNGVVVMSLPPR